jgi:hypothetical protein
MLPGWGRLVLVCGVLALPVGLGVSAQPATTAPRCEPPQGDAQVPPATAGISPEAVELTEAQKALLASVVDGDRELLHPALYVLLARAAEMKALSAAAFERLERPAFAKMLRSPSQYRGQAIQMDLLVFGCAERSPGRGIGFSRHWPRGRPVWRMSCCNAASKTPAEETLVVFSVNDPRGALGRADRPDADGNALFDSPGRRVRAAGLFYKVYSDRDLGGSERPFPVVVAWQVERSTFGRQPRPVSPWLAVLLVALVGMAMGFLFLKRYIRRQNRPPAAADRLAYQSLRGSEGKPEAGGARPKGDDSVDPRLRDAAEQFRRDRGCDGQDHKG